MIPSGWANRSVVMPHGQGVPPLDVGIFPLARRDGRHVPGGAAKSGAARYWDLQAFVWYHTGGMVTLNRGRKRIGRTFRGAEDGRRYRG